MKYLFFLILLTHMIFISCTEKMDMQTAPVKPILVVNSLITPDSVFSCWVSQISSLNSKENNRITDATVEIYEGETENKLADLEHVSNGYYRAGNDAKPGVHQSYTIRVSAPGFAETATATTSVPEKVYPDTAYLVFGVGKELLGPGNIQRYNELHFTISDKGNQENYYEVFAGGAGVDSIWRYSKVPPLSAIDTTVYDTLRAVFDIEGWATFTNNDPVLANENLLKTNPEVLVFSDELFNGNSYHFNIRNNGFTLDGGAFEEIYGIFNLISESRAYYQYRKRYFHHSESIGKNYDTKYDENVGLSFIKEKEPIEMYSNVRNGFGIFAGFNASVLYTEVCYEFDGKRFNRHDYKYLVHHCYNTDPGVMSDKCDSIYQHANITRDVYYKLQEPSLDSLANMPVPPDL